MRGSLCTLCLLAIVAVSCNAQRIYRPSSGTLSAKAFAHSSRSAARRRALLARTQSSSVASPVAQSGSNNVETPLSPSSNSPVQSYSGSGETRFGGLASLSPNRLGSRHSIFSSLSNRRLPQARRTSYRSRRPQQTPYTSSSSSSSRHSGHHQGTAHHGRNEVSRPAYGALKEGRTGVLRYGNTGRGSNTRTSGQAPGNPRINIESKITAPLPPKPHLETITVGETAILHCSFESVVKIGEYRQAQIWWTKMPSTAHGRAVVLASGGQVRIPDDRLKVVSFSDNGFSVLVIRASVEEDSAEYKCSIPTVSGYKINYQKLKVQAAPDSRVQSNEKERHVEEGDQVPFFCNPNFPGIDNNVLSVWWTAKGPKGRNLQINGNQEKFLGNQFNIESMEKDMEGVYTCHVENPDGLPIRKHFSVVLKEAPWKIEAYKQNLNVDTVLSRYTKDARVGEKVNLRCDSGGNPAPVVRWMKNGRQLAPQESKIYISSYTPSYRPNAVVSKLLVTNFALLDQGRYTCIVENELGARERDFEVKAATSDAGNRSRTGSSNNVAPVVDRDARQEDRYLPSKRQETLYQRVGGSKRKNENKEEGSGNGLDDEDDDDDSYNRRG